MNVMTRVSSLARSPGDPEVLSPGPSARSGADRLARGLGWFSLGLGAVELLAPHTLGRALGMEGEGKATMLRAFGAREIAAGILSLSVDAKAGIASRVAGDTLDIAALLSARRQDNPKQRNVDLALAAVITVTVVDILCLRGLQRVHNRPREQWRDYSDRSGLPRGVEASRGLARETAPAM